MTHPQPPAYGFWRLVSGVAIIALVVAIVLIHPAWFSDLGGIVAFIEKNALLLLLALLGLFLVPVLLRTMLRGASTRVVRRGMYQEAAYPYNPDLPRRQPAGCFGPLVALLLIALLVVFGWPWLARTFPVVNQVLPHIASVSSTSVSPNTAKEYNTIVGDPDLSASFVNRVLAAANSPAQGLGTTLFALSLNYHIKTSFALGVLHHESDYGLKGVARVAHGWNIRCTPGWKCIDGFRYYPTFADGAADFYRTIHDEYLPRGRNSLTTIIPVYSPAADGNNPTQYIQAIQADVARWDQGQV